MGPRTWCRVGGQEGGWWGWGCSSTGPHALHAVLVVATFDGGGPTALVAPVNLLDLKRRPVSHPVHLLQAGGNEHRTPISNCTPWRCDHKGAQWHTAPIMGLLTIGCRNCAIHFARQRPLPNRAPRGRGG